VQLYSLIVITIIFPYAVRFSMTRLGHNELAYIMLWAYTIGLFAMGYPLISLISLIHNTVLFIMDYSSLKE